MFRGIRAIAKEEAGEKRRATVGVRHLLSNENNNRGVQEQIRDLICAYLDHPFDNTENAAQQQMDRTTEVLSMIFSGAREGGSPEGASPCLIDQLIDVSSTVVDRYQRPASISPETRRASEIPAWIGPAAGTSSTGVPRDR